MVTMDGNQRMRHGLESVAGCWLVILPLLRPLVWNGDAGSLPNLFYLILLAAATATGLMLRSVVMDATPRPRPWALWLGAAFLAWAAIGCVRSPLPAQAWLLWLGWVLHLAAPLALWPEIRRRPQCVVAGLCAGLGLELAVMAGQKFWERPAMQRDLALDPDLVPQESMRGQYTVRVHSWRLEGSFLLANTLAAFLILLWPLVVDLAWKSWRGVGRWWIVALAILTTVALAMTGSKAAILAWLIVLACAVAAWRPRFRLLAFTSLVLVVGLALAVPAVRAKAAGSFAERWGYWRGALVLIAERPLAGWGLEGFSVHFPRVKPPETEPTVAVHNEPLQAASDVGLVGAALLLAWWGWVVVGAFGVRRAMTGGQPVSILENSSQRFLPMIAALATAVAVFGMGVLHPQLVSYPGECWWLWGLLYAAGAGLLVHLGLRLPRPSSVALGLGVAMCLLHSGADFTLHSLQVVGILAWVAALGMTLGEAPAQDAPASARRENLLPLAGFAVVLLGLGVMLWGQDRSERRDQGRELVEALRRTLLWRDHGGEDLRVTAIERLNLALLQAGQLALPADSPAPHHAPQLATLTAKMMTDLIQAAARFPADVDQARVAAELAAHLHQLRPDLIVTMTDPMRSLVADWQQEPFAVQGMAWHLRRLAQLDTAQAAVHLREAQTWLRRAVDLSPGYLPIREQLVAVSRELGDQATVDSESAVLRRLAPIVHETGRATQHW